jgi:UDP-N-acetylmuramyl pentapeptide synthase
VPRALSLCYAQIMKFSAREIAQATGGLLIDGSPEALCDGVSTDSRTIRPGQLFVPLRGSRCDGHEFIADARARGAAGVLLQTPPPAPPRPDFVWTVHLAAFGGKTNGPGEAWSPSPFRGGARGEVIGVPDTARALSDLARWAVKKLNKPIIAVAG